MPYYPNAHDPTDTHTCEARTSLRVLREYRESQDAVDDIGETERTLVNTTIRELSRARSQHLYHHRLAEQLLVELDRVTPALDTFAMIACPDAWTNLRTLCADLSGDILRIERQYQADRPQFYASTGDMTDDPHAL